VDHYAPRGPHLVSILARLRVDPYILALLATVALASVLPVKGTATARFNDATTIAIGLLFFLRQWRLHSVVLASTYLLFPLLGLAARVLVPSVLSPELCAGVMFLCCLPSTVQSSIAFTSIARGNVAAAICSASFSNLIGIVLTPSLVALFLFTSGGGISFGLVVYTAFSGGVVAGIWSRLSPRSFLLLAATNTLLLTIVICTTTIVARRLGFGRSDEITIVFRGSKKSLTSGIPMATVLFPASIAGVTVLPLMLFHQIQLMTCAWLARRYANRSLEDLSGKVSPGSPRRVGAHRRTSQVRPGDLAASSAGPVASQPRPWSS
jgi:sodium/bile acid cotransporter 7